MTITIRAIARHECEAARQLLLANGWSGPRFEPARWAAVVAGSSVALVAVVTEDPEERVVGFGRSITDGISNGYLCTLVVDAAYRQQGIARALVARLLGDDPDMTWVLRADRPGLQAFYEKLGWRKSVVTMERVRASA